MNILARIVIFVLVLQVTVPVRVGLAQTPKATKPGATAKPTKPGKKQSTTKDGLVPPGFSAAIKSFDEFVAKQMTFDKTVGLSIGFMKDDFIWVKGFGFADLENSVPAKAESAYRLASVTKPMTALAIMQLVEKGKINLDAEVQTYVPYFPKKKWPVTVRQVVGHLGGISHYKNPAQELHIKDHKSTREAIAIFENFDLVAEPGTRYSYSSYGYNLLGAIIEAASGMSYAEYMRQNIWQPLGMNDTRMDDPLEVIPHRVRGYQIIDGKLKNSEFVNISSRFAAGGTRSTVPDLLKFARGVIDHKLISADSMKVVNASMSTKAGRFTNYGMGWETTPYNGRYVLVHSGGQQETRTLLYILPSRNMAFAIGSNFEGGNPGVYLDRLFQLVTGAPLVLDAYSPDKVKRAIAEGIKSTFNYGSAEFERSRKSLAADDADLAAAFGYFNEQMNPITLNEALPGALDKIRAGVHPLGKQSFTKVGSYMAQKLAAKNGPKGVERYGELGGLAFFQDYIALSATDPTIPKQLRFNDAFATLVSEMAKDWSRSNSEYVRKLWLHPESDLELVASELSKSFTGASVYPNVLDSFLVVTRQLIVRGDRQRAARTSELAVKFYPGIPTAHLFRGIAQVVNRDPGGGKASFQKAMAIDASGVNPGTINSVAYQLAGAGMVDEGLAILNIGIELFPKEANLYDSVGEFQLRKGEKLKALDSYKKALEVNPNFSNADNAREIVKKLSSELAVGSK
jgi:CubicO group peptidase (beta-lactamase class C family)